MTAASIEWWKGWCKLKPYCDRVIGHDGPCLERCEECEYEHGHLGPHAPSPADVGLPESLDA